MTLANILWLIVVVLVVLWLLSLIGGLAGNTPIIHLLIVIAAIVLIYNLFVGRRTV